MRMSDWSSDVCSSDLPSRCLRRRGGAAARDRALCRGKGPLMRIGVYPGTFDPITLGHMDIIRHGAKLVDRLVNGVTTNISKSTLFDYDECISIVWKAVRQRPWDHRTGRLQEQKKDQ